MKISYNWLKDYLPLNEDPYQIGEKLSLTGLEVEEIIEKKLDIPNVVVGKVLSSEKHPNADKLSVCRVDVGDEELTIVCGAPNVAPGQTVPVAKVGALLPIGMKIRKSKIRGVESVGMICSEEELGLAEHSDGIWVLPDTLPIGVPLAQALQFETDYILDISVTPNRPDCLSHIGVAREVGAIIGKPIQKPEVQLSEMDQPAADYIKIRIDTPEGCPRYAARVIRNIRVGESPAWLVQRLEAVGMRSINNVVDVTNYVMMETGHPLHAFDYDLIRGGQIIVRESVEGEKFTTLDDKEHTLKAGTVLICDAERPVAIGGIMGGLNSEVNQNTVNILLESAYFKPESIQRSARYLDIHSEASQRFERGADPNGVLYALDRAAQLIAELAGGEVLKGAVDEYPRKIEPKRIPLKTEQINRLLGTNLSAKEMSEILERIELRVEDGEVVVPTFRPDLERVADLAEEVARLYGLDNIPAKEQTVIQYRIPRNELDFFADRLREILTGMGIQEVITNSMINREVWEKLTGKPIYPILNPISRDMDGMRNSLLPSLAQVIQHNRNRQIKDLRIFEINRTFHPGSSLNEQPKEVLRLAIAITGKRDGNVWYSTHQDVDVYDIKGIMEALLDKISLDNYRFIYYSDSVLESPALQIVAGNEELGMLGELNHEIASFYEIDDSVFVAELNVSNLLENRRTDKKYQPIPRFPYIDRDLALVVDQELEAGKLIELIRQKGGKLLSRVEIFDIYRGKQIPPDKKSVALRLIFQSPERTLKEEEVNRTMTKIIKAVEATFQAKLRE